MIIRTYAKKPGLYDKSLVLTILYLWKNRVSSTPCVSPDYVKTRLGFIKSFFSKDINMEFKMPAQAGFYSVFNVNVVY